MGEINNIQLHLSTNAMADQLHILNNHTIAQNVCEEIGHFADQTQSYLNITVTW